MTAFIRGLTALITTGTLLCSHFSVMASNSELTIARQQQLIHMLKQDCGSCHGMSLKGGLGPTLLPNTMNKLPVAVIQHTILFGRPGTAMPPWKSILTEQEALWISQQLQQGVENHD
ncbi:c-type cytochrome [Cognaticolwellia aestuarii]|uniref:c-type cytochrome n=1 Tax=Cognaticolwellia aestuarii TaxID=329993 RepID=UPI0009871E85|nr:cytochrome c [Cognaticolwellia aestuarii]